MLLPKCPRCGSKEVEVGELDSTQVGFWMTCKDCRFVFRWVGTK
jgi:transcription elongation factor Elf1